MQEFSEPRWLRLLTNMTGIRSKSGFRRAGNVDSNDRERRLQRPSSSGLLIDEAPVTVPVMLKHCSESSPGLPRPEYPGPSTSFLLTPRKSGHGDDSAEGVLK
jgi:hypothetical protein